ncbi:efflux RND transporter permease subunit [Alkalimarinus alittae]|uniref:Efflux RND transporter permease subunit n=1 Tax=Alkalimarinus alittae TaxID=2961619 RepID=A0ABY6N2R4_9ALTE|nr:efflux RND transporter permease subunit [Alkalimarinus alittae]UZE96376.1 efflux RND transporter permease subunit [Alkalimarinus alittae]
MIHFFAAHPTASRLIMGLFLLAGVLTLPEIKRETFPQINSYEVQVAVPYPGASPIDVEQAICRPLEDALDGISFTEEKRCEARNSIGYMTIKMLDEGDFREFNEDIKSAVDGIDSFPDKAETPVITELGRTQSVITVAVVADIPRPELKNLAEDMKQRMLRDTIVPLVDIQGFSTRQFKIQVSQHNLRQYGLSLQDIALLVSKQNIDLPAGDITTQDRNYQIRFSDEKRSIDELKQLVIIGGGQRNEVRLADIATITDGFDNEEDKVTFNGKPAAFLKINKNTRDDSLTILDATEQFIAEQKQRLPEQVELYLTQDQTSIINDRIEMLSTNAWQGLILVFVVMWLFFGTRYAFWVVMGLPISFLAGAFLLGNIGVSINMFSMVALLLALGILMDDAIVISESIGSQMKRGKKPIDAAVDGTKLVAKGVISSFLTTLCIFSGLLFLKGNIGQILVIIPTVLIAVISVSLIEAFFILPHHLQKSLTQQNKADKAKGWESRFRERFDTKFDEARAMIDRWVAELINVRYAFMGTVVAVFIISVSILASDVIKFSPFPNVEGDLIQARILMPTGTSLNRTEEVVKHYTESLQLSNERFTQKGNPAVEAVTVEFNTHADAFEAGPHLATISVDMRTAEERDFTLNAFMDDWRDTAGVVPDVWSVAFKDPSIGPGGRAIHIRLQGENLDELSQASHELQHWLAGYPGVNNLIDDLRPGKPEFTLHLKAGAFSLGIDAQTVASQLRAAYHGAKVIDSTVGLETYEVSVMLDEASKDELADFDSFPIIHPKSGAIIPLAHVADISPTRSYSRINRVDNQRTVTIYGDIDSDKNNTAEVLADLKKGKVAELQAQFPNTKINFEGEVKEAAETQGSMRIAFILGLAGVFILLSFQFRSYAEPLVVMLNIPLAFIGVVFGHWLMGIDITMPSLLGFVSLSGIVVNDSILLVEFVKRHVSEGMSVHEAAARASHDRFRAVLLTSLTTMAGMAPLLFETSLQAQILIPLATSIFFGIASSTLLVLFVVPCFYSILEDFGVAKASRKIQP